MEHVIWTHKDPERPDAQYGFQFSDRVRDLCASCPDRGMTVLTLWRGGHGSSFNLCGRCAQELGIQLIRRT